MDMRKQLFLCTCKRKCNSLALILLTINPRCPEQYYIERIEFASHGEINGCCGYFRSLSSVKCSRYTKSVVEDACYGRNACAVDSRNLLLQKENRCRKFLEKVRFQHLVFLLDS